MRQVAITLSKLANGSGLSKHGWSQLYQCISCLPADSIRQVFELNRPIIKPIWKALMDDVPGHRWQHHEKFRFAHVPHGSQQGRALFRILIEVGLQAGGLIDRSSSACVAAAIHLHCEDLIKPLLRYGVPLVPRDRNGLCSTVSGVYLNEGDPLLFCASNTSSPVALQILLEAGADIQERDAIGGCTTLGNWVHRMWKRPPTPAAYECADLILGAGARVDDPALESALPSILDFAFLTNRYVFDKLVPHSRLFHSSLTICGVLNAAEAGIVPLKLYLNETRCGNFSQPRRKEVLEYALVASASQMQTVKILLDLGVDGTATTDLLDFKANNYGEWPSAISRSLWTTAITRAARDGLEPETRSLLTELMQAGAKITETVLAAAVALTGTELLEFLISSLDDVKTIAPLAMAAAISAGNKAAVQLFLSKGADLNSTVIIPAQHTGLKPRRLLHAAMRGSHLDDDTSPDAWTFRDTRVYFDPPSLDMMQYIMD